jgi:LacI family transcriptional regulator
VKERARRSRSPTIIDVAAQAGVSPMTVSRVINGRASVDPTTRASVQDAIKALGYTPNLAARSLVTSTELKIGVIYANPSAAFMSDFLTGVFEEASIRGARLILLKGEDGRPPSPAALETLVATGISGMICAPPLSESAAVLDVLRKARVPVAAVGAHDVDDVICVRIDDRLAAYEMTRELIAMGHRRLGFVVGNPDQVASLKRLDGFYAAVREHPGICATIAQMPGCSLQADPPPTAIFASNDDMAAAVVSVAHRRQLDVPRELTVVGFDDTTAAVMLWPPLTTVHQPVRRLAAEALGLLVAEIAAPPRTPAKRADRVLDHEIVKRQSTSSPQDDGKL